MRSDSTTRGVSAAPSRSLMFATGMARTTYLDKIAVEKSDLAPTLSLGVSLDHLVSMTVPTLGGLLWDRSGYAYVFLAAAVLAVLNGVAASCIRTPKGVSAPGQ